MCVTKFSKQDIAHDDHFLADARPAGQAEHRAPVAFVHHAFADEVVVLAMIHDRQPEHARVFQRAAHQLVVLNTMSIIRYRHDAGVCIEPIGAISSPARFFVIAPVVKTFTQALVGRRLIDAIVLGLSTTGDVFGMQTTLVNPPAAAARVPVSMVSLPTGRARADARECRSGRDDTTRPLASMISSNSDSGCRAAPLKSSIRLDFAIDKPVE